jgi:hypothetical protein
MSSARTAASFVALAAAGVLALTGTLRGADAKIRADFDKQFDFSRVSTWGWDPSEAGDVKMARSADDDPADIKRRFGPTIVDAVALELGKRGLTSAPGTPDVRFHYYLLVTVGINAQTMGQFLPAVPQWGLPPFVPQTQSFNVIQTGSLVLDALSTQQSAVVWRGIAQAELAEQRNDEQRKTRLRTVIRDLVRRFPRK